MTAFWNHYRLVFGVLFLLLLLLTPNHKNSCDYGNNTSRYCNHSPRWLSSNWCAKRSPLQQQRILKLPAAVARTCSIGFVSGMLVASLPVSGVSNLIRGHALLGHFISTPHIPIKVNDQTIDEHANWKNGTDPGQSWGDSQNGCKDGHLASFEFEPGNSRPNTEYGDDKDRKTPKRHGHIFNQNTEIYLTV